MRTLLISFIVVLLLSGCTTRTKYYPPTKDVFIEKKDEDGKVIEVRGAVMEESEGFTLGSQGQGSYRLFDINAVGR